ncbi:hypothetical protein KHA94_05265 [Bacillus sp. FJAT-49705]|uniref:Pyruvate kinase n=1 Tax=Cytobacillus citreus TaxID=2833586 RepID=A0ABS5NP95_9BACI|nr:pyruvate kinase [Cytobacillus citreus]MBS4189620.1 hypothetical protein [Cytobacillus citreus]
MKLNYSLVNKLSDIHDEIEKTCIPFIKENSSELFSLSNLIAYLSLRNNDLSKIQSNLLQEGLASFHDIHPHVQYSIQKMLNNLNKKDIQKKYLLDTHLSNQINEERVKRLFGSKIPSIMVTLHSSMIDNPKIIKDLLYHGMSIARINCAHDSPQIWKKLVQHVRDAEKEIGRDEPQCKIHMELAGPKIRVKKIIEPEYTSAVDEKPYFKVVPGDYITIIKKNHALNSITDQTKVITINVTGALTNVRLKDSIYFHDGKIVGEICSITDDWVRIKILYTNKKMAKLREEHGINLPDSFVHFILSAITEEDLKNLPIIYDLSDSIGLSFVHFPRDLAKFRMHLDSLPQKKISVIAKIETKEAVQNLSKIIIEGLAFDSFGIMIARGDLAVELGLNQLAFIQEEILNLCRAAHTPIIWATGVLENQTKKGMPLRSEITDAYMGLRADCIMLNKGEFIIESVKTLNELIHMKQSKTSRLGNKTFIQYGF